MSAKEETDLNAMEEDDSDTSDAFSDEDERHPEAYTGNEEVQVEFEGRTPVDPDSHGISQLLARVFLKAHINCMQLADLIIAQNYVGSVIGLCESDAIEDTDSDEDMCEDGTIFGITTVLNITAKKDEPCIQQLRAYILQRAEKNATDAVLMHFRDVLGNDARPVGYLINERFINIPPQIAVPLWESLRKEIADAKSKGMKFDFTYFIMVIKFYRKKAKKGKPPGEDTYTNAEEEAIAKKALNSFEFSVVDECDTGMSGDWLEGDATLIPYRKIILLDAKQLPDIIQDVKAFIAGE